MRKVLNFGHTLAHAIEKQLAYRGLRHGEAVAYGMLFALRLANRRGLLDDGDADSGLAFRLRRLLHRFELPPLPLEALDVDTLVEVMAGDKKASEAGLVWVLPRALGRFTFDGVPTAVVVDELRRFLADPWSA